MHVGMYVCVDVGMNYVRACGPVCGYVGVFMYMCMYICMYVCM